MIDCAAFGGGVADFYAGYAGGPVIVRGAFSACGMLRGLGSAEVESLFAGHALWAFDHATLTKGEFVASEEIFSDQRRGVARYNVVDHDASASPFSGHVSPPRFLSHNWFAGSGPEAAWHVMSVNCTVEGTMSPIHIDPYGMQGWLYLIYGRKTWRVYPRRAAPLLYDPIFGRFYNRLRDSSDLIDRYPYVDLAECWEGTVGPGELIYFPAGSPHEVLTTEASFGLGSAVLNDFQIVESTRSWLWERSQVGEGGIDFEELLRTALPSRCFDESGRARVSEALALCAEWSAARAERAQ